MLLLFSKVYFDFSFCVVGGGGAVNIPEFTQFLYSILKVYNKYIKLYKKNVQQTLKLMGQNNKITV